MLRNTRNKGTPLRSCVPNEHTHYPRTYVGKAAVGRLPTWPGKGRGRAPQARSLPGDWHPRSVANSESMSHWRIEPCVSRPACRCPRLVDHYYPNRGPEGYAEPRPTRERMTALATPMRPQRRAWPVRLGLQHQENQGLVGNPPPRHSGRATPIVATLVNLRPEPGCATGSDATNAFCRGRQTHMPQLTHLHDWNLR